MGLQSVVKVDRFNNFVKIIVIINITIIIIMIIIMIMTLLLLFFSHPMCYSLIKPNPSLEFEEKYFRCNCWSFISLFLVFTVKRFCFGIKKNLFAQVVLVKPGFHIVVSVVSVVRKKFIGQIEFILSRTTSCICRFFCIEHLYGGFP